MRVSRDTARRLLALVFTFAMASSTVVAQSGFQIVVHESNPVSSLSVSELEDLFLVKQKKWSHGDACSPVDLAAGSQIRDAFSSEVLDRDVTAVKAFWQQQIFSGRGVPPPEVATEQEVLDYVKSRRAAVGYVSTGATIPAGVKAVKIR